MTPSGVDFSSRPQVLFVSMQPDDQQSSYQQSEALHQVMTPSSMVAQAFQYDMPSTHFQAAFRPSATHDIPSDVQPAWELLQQRPSPGCSPLQGDSGAHYRASSAQPPNPALQQTPLGQQPQQGLLPANGLARPSLSLPQPEWPAPDWQQGPGSVTTLPQQPLQSYHPQPAQSGKATAQPHSAGPVHPLTAASGQHYPTRHSLPQQRQLPRHEWMHMTDRGDMLQSTCLAQGPQSSIAASGSTAHPSWGMPSGSGRDPLNTPAPNPGNSTSPWSVPTLLQSPPNAMPACSLTAAPAISTWPVSHPSPQDLPPRPHPPQGPHPCRPASLPFPGQHSSALAPHRPASRCDHPMYVHLDLSRPLCLQHPPTFGHPGISESYWRSASPSCAARQGPSVQQQPQSTVSDVGHMHHQQLHGDYQYQQGFPGLHALHAQQQGHALGHVALGPEQLGGQTQPGVNLEDCTAPQLQHGWIHGGVTLQATLIAVLTAINFCRMCFELCIA